MQAHRITVERELCPRQSLEYVEPGGLVTQGEDYLVYANADGTRSLIAWDAEGLATVAIVDPTEADAWIP